MSLQHDDLVALALGEDPHLEAQLSDDDRAELARIKAHLGLHDQVEEVQPRPDTWNALRARIEAEDARPSVFRRFWMTGAAAALIALAIFIPRSEVPATRVHGSIAKSGGNTFTSTGVSRMTIGDGVTVTMDDATTVTLLSNERLALKAGRVFLEVSRNRGGFTVETDDLTATTLGTAFSVETDRVMVERGRVRCTAGDDVTEIGAGEWFSTGPWSGFTKMPSPRSWFSLPRITATVLTPNTLRIVIQNDMPDPIQLAPPTGGEPLFFATYAGRDFPLTPAGFDATLTLDPGDEETFELRLPKPLPDREALLVSHPATGVRSEAVR